MKNSGNKTQIEGLVVLVLFGLFAICIMGVLLTGAGAYKRLVNRQQEAYAERTVPGYITTKIRQADAEDTVRLAEFCGVEALEIAEAEGYITRIYCYGGYLRELFSASEGAFEPEDGQKILEAEQISFSMTNGCLEVVVTTENGEKTTLKRMLRSTEGGQEQ